MKLFRFIFVIVFTLVSFSPLVCMQDAEKNGDEGSEESRKVAIALGKQEDDQPVSKESGQGQEFIILISEDSKGSKQEFKMPRAMIKESVMLTQFLEDMQQDDAQISSIPLSCSTAWLRFFVECIDYIQQQRAEFIDNEEIVQGLMVYLTEHDAFSDVKTFFSYYKVAAYFNAPLISRAFARYYIQQDIQPVDLSDDSFTGRCTLEECEQEHDHTDTSYACHIHNDCLRGSIIKDFQHVLLKEYFYCTRQWLTIQVGGQPEVLQLIREELELDGPQAVIFWIRHFMASNRDPQDLATYNQAAIKAYFDSLPEGMTKLAMRLIYFSCTRQAIDNTGLEACFYEDEDEDEEFAELSFSGIFKKNPELLPHLHDFILLLSSYYQIRKLDLSCNDLTELPESLGYCKELVKLDLHGNEFEDIPPIVGKLENLRALSLHANCLETISDDPKLPKNLTHLDLSVNKLTTLPASFALLENLFGIDLSSNDIEIFPEQLCALITLNNLDMSENRLRSLPGTIGNLTKLESLSLSENLLVELPQEFAQLTNLVDLLLGHNYFEEFPLSLLALSKLKILRLCENLIREIPQEICQLGCLKELSLSCCDLQALPDALGSLHALHTLKVSYNRIIALSQATLMGRALAHLEVDGNQLTTLPPAVCSLEVLMARHNPNLVLDEELQAYLQKHGVDAHFDCIPDPGFTCKPDLTGAEDDDSFEPSA